MRKLNLDYVRHENRGRWVGVFLVAAGLAVLAHVVIGFMSLRSEIEDRELRSVATSRRLPKAPSGYDEAKSRHLVAEIGRANRIIDQLALPWGNLFAAVEATMNEDVALLTLAPDSQRNTIRLTAETKTYDDMIAYFERVGQQKVFRNAHIVNHEIVEQDQQRPVRFTLVASWRKE